MPTLLILLAAILAAVAVYGCGDDAAASLNGELRYVRSGGFAGDHDELVVRPDGSATLQARRGGERSFDLTADELEALGAEAEAMKPADVRSQRPAPDAFVYTVTYDGVTGTTDDPNLSKSGLAPVIGKLEKILDAHR